MTRSIQRIEEAAGVPLFARDNRSVMLTDAGEKFRAFARQTLTEWEALRKDIRAADNVGGQMSIYASVTATYSILPDLLKSYREAYPEVQIELHTGSAEDSVRQVVNGETDPVRSGTTGKTTSRHRVPSAHTNKPRLCAGT